MHMFGGQYGNPERSPRQKAKFLCPFSKLSKLALELKWRHLRRVDRARAERAGFNAPAGSPGRFAKKCPQNVLFGNSVATKQNLIGPKQRSHIKGKLVLHH